MTEKPENFESAHEIQEITASNQSLLVDIREKIGDKKTREQISAAAERFATLEDRKAFITEEGGAGTGFVEVVLNDKELPKGAPKLPDILELAHLSRIGVLEDHRGRGRAKELLKVAEEYAKSNGKRGMWLDYLAKNEPALALYLSAGYKDIAEFKDGDKDRLRRITVKYFDHE